jgi:hypothetical protein
MHGTNLTRWHWLFNAGGTLRHLDTIVFRRSTYDEDYLGFVG